jgi:chromosome partitioning protein
MIKTFAVINHKGGVGKTTSAVNIAAGLARAGERVLLIDADPQGSATASLYSETEAGADLHEVLNGATLTPETFAENLDRIRGSERLAEFESRPGAGAEMRLAEALAPARRKYDRIIIDPPPGLGLLTLSAMIASDSVLIPVQAQMFAIDAAERTWRYLENVASNWGKTYKDPRLFVTFYNERRRLDRESLEILRETFGGSLLKAKVRANVALAEAPVAGRPVFETAGRSKGAEDYAALVKELRKAWS